MAVRDLSPSVWTAPGVARVSLGLILSAFNNDRQALDEFMSAYSPSSRQTVNLSSGANTFTIPDTTNARFILVEMPFGNTVTCILKWNNADTGKYINAAGFYFDTFAPGNIPTTLYLTAGAAINGVTISVF